MFAIVDAEMSISFSAPRCRRSGDSGALVSENGTDAASLMFPPRCGRLDGGTALMVGRDDPQGKVWRPGC